MIKAFTIGVAIGAAAVHSLLPTPLGEPPSSTVPLPEIEVRYEPIVPPEGPTTTPILKAEPAPEPEPVPEGAFCTSDCPLIEVKKEVEEYYADKPILIEIARCESRFRQWDESGRVLKNEQGSSATGVMQIMASYHAGPANVLGYDIETLEGNLAYAAHLYEEQGTKPWEASEYCWGSSMVAINKGISDV